MPDLTIRPTAKFIKAGAVGAIVIFIGLEVAYVALKSETSPSWPMVIPPLVLLWPLARWVRRRFTRTVVSGDRLRHEVGLASRSTRNIQLSKVQDVRVDQGMWQRMFNVGDLSIETAGETSRLTLRHVDSPQELADEIMNRAQKGPAAS